jgi:hypothetical protein
MEVCKKSHRTCFTSLVIFPVLWNRNYFLRFRFWFRLLETYGSVLVPVPAPYLDQKSKFFRQILEIFLPFYMVNFFTRKKIYQFQQFYFFVKSE